MAWLSYLSLCIRDTIGSGFLGFMRVSAGLINAWQQLICSSFGLSLSLSHSLISHTIVQGFCLFFFALIYLFDLPANQASQNALSQSYTQALELSTIFTACTYVVNLCFIVVRDNCRML